MPDENPNQELDLPAAMAKQRQFDIEFAIKCASEKDGINPMLVIFGSDGKAAICSLMDGDLRTHAPTLRKIVSQMPAPPMMVTYMAEAWTLQIKDHKPGAPLPPLRPRDHPDRIEVVLAHAVWRENGEVKQSVRMHEIIRASDGTPVVSPNDIGDSQGGKPTGPTADFLQSLLGARS